MTKARDIANAGTALSSVDATELGYLDGVTSNIQTQFSNISGSKAQPTEPSSPTDGMIWVDTDGSTTDANFIPKTLTSTTGDIIYASSANTPARLGIGSTGNVLTVSGGIPAWAAPASGDFVLINTTSFSAVSSQSVNDVFSSTYDNYVIKLNNCTGSTDLFVALRLRVSGTDTTTNYRYQNIQADSTTVAGSRSTSTTSFPNVFYINSGFNNEATLNIANPFNTKRTTGFSHNVTGGDANIEFNVTGYGLNDATSYTGFTLLTSTGNMTGSVSVYGYKK